MVQGAETFEELLVFCIHWNEKLLSVGGKPPKTPKIILKFSYGFKNVLPTPFEWFSNLSVQE